MPFSRPRGARRRRPPAPSARPGRALQFFLRRQISTEQLRAISMLNDLFARNLTHNLAAWLRTRFQVTWSRPSRSSSTNFCCAFLRSAMSPRCAWSRSELSRCCSSIWAWRRR